MPQVAVPLFDHPGGNYTISRAMILQVSCPTQFSHIAWTDNGTDPVPHGNGNQTPGSSFIYIFRTSGTYTIKAVGYRDDTGYTPSEEVTNVYVITFVPITPPPRPVAPPFFTPPNGNNLTFPFDVNVDSLDGVGIIIYTENDPDTPPSWSHGVQDGTHLILVLTGDTVLRAVSAAHDPDRVSNVRVGNYTGTAPVVSQPQLAPPSAVNVTFPFPVNISTDVPGAIVIYTLNDSLQPPSWDHGIRGTPNADVSLTMDTTIRAVAALGPENISDVAMGTYTSAPVGPPPAFFGGEGGVTVIVSDQDTIFGGVLIAPGIPDMGNGTASST